MAVCEDCKGSGCDAEKTAARNKREPGSSGYVRCWTCNGNGLEPTYPSKGNTE